MSKLYRFHPNADKKLDDIWLHGYQQWNEQQADKYIDGLYDVVEKIAHNLSYPTIKTIPEYVMPNVKYIHYQRHYLFFREAAPYLEEKIQVLAILHDSMDIPARLWEELKNL